MSEYTFKYGKKLRNGYTTGTAATAAAKAAVKTLVEDKNIKTISVLLPSDEIIDIPVIENKKYDDYAIARVMVDGGDDKNVLNKCIISCKAKKTDKFKIKAGSGIGIVTKPGLSVEVGKPAINPVPLKMIELAVKSYDFNNNFEVEISVENGEELAKKTLNERLGVIGGISIIGTTGITEPMSNRGYIDSMYRQMNVMLSESKYITVVSGNYGYSYAINKLDINENKVIKVSNYVGEALFYLRENNAKNILMVGHIGKFVKIAGGNFNTHSYISDARMEIIASAVLRVTKNKEEALKILDCNTTDEAYNSISEEDRESVFNFLCEEALKRIKQVIKFTETKVQFAMFNSERKLVGHSEKFYEMVKEIND